MAGSGGAGGGAGGGGGGGSSHGGFGDANDMDAMRGSSIAGSTQDLELTVNGAPPPGYQSQRGVPPKTNKESIAETRGKNWALPGASQGSVGVTRPLRIEVAADQLVIDSGNPGATRQVIPCPGQTEEAIEKFVSIMWEQMRGWGIAGRGMHWKPVLNLHVLPGGERRAAELRDLLAGSGMDVKVQP